MKAEEKKQPPPVNYTDDSGPWLRLAVAILSLARDDYIRVLRGERLRNTNGNPEGRQPNSSREEIEAWLLDCAGGLLGPAHGEAVIRAWRMEAAGDGHEKAYREIMRAEYKERERSRARRKERLNP